ncbi:hypothetical protein [Pseudomonas sp.]|uniref:hypothetical protein n=1 Tax=Pseudomonas sp. TaxID=306 RepID=UPI003D0C9879
MNLHQLLICAIVFSPLAAKANCDNKIKEFALLSHMEMTEEAASLYRELLIDCSTALSRANGRSPPTLQQQDQWLVLGKALYLGRRDDSSQQALAALTGVQIAHVEGTELQGIGPDNMTKAIGGMALDTAANVLQNRGEWQKASDIQGLADRVRGDEKRWTPETQIAGAPGGNAASQPQVALPAILQQIDCNGDLSFLTPLLREYRDPLFQEPRHAILGASTPKMLNAARQLGQSKAETIQSSRLQSIEYDRSAAEAAQTAQQTDGHGNRSIPLAISDQLPLDFQCEVNSIHASAVCDFIIMRWGSLASRATAAVVEKCWK